MAAIDARETRIERPRAAWRLGLWLGAAALLALLPSVFVSGTALTTMSLMGIMIVFALSYNMLLGQTGMLSFGHAVYYGLGGFLAVHAMNTAIRDALPVPVLLIPLVGGAAGLLFGVIFGSVSTRRGGTAFAMISLGIGELVASSALILRGFFGGEEGITTNRTRLLHLFDWNFGPQLQVYYLIAAWCFLCMLAMHALSRTPFGRMCNAVRDNAERAEFIGYNAQRVRFLAFVLAGGFAGIAGGLAAINFEIMNSVNVGAGQSGSVLLMTYIGGTGSFIGPVLGAVLITFLQLMLSDVTEIWQLYFGLLFIFMVMFAPAGISGLLMMHAPLWRARVLHRVVPAYLLAALPALIGMIGVSFVIEMTYRLTTKADEGSAFRFLHQPVDARSPLDWIVAAVLILGGFWLFRRARTVVSGAWADALALARHRGWA